MWLESRTILVSYYGILALEIHQPERVGLKKWSHHDLDVQLKRELHRERVVHLHVLRGLEGELHHQQHPSYHTPSGRSE